MFVSVDQKFLIVNKIIGFAFAFYWLVVSRQIVFSSFLIRYLLFIFYSIGIAFIVNANWEGVWGEAKTMLQLSFILFFVYNLSFSIKFKSDLQFLSLFLIVNFIIAYFGASFGLALDETSVSGRLTGLTSNANSLGFITLYGLIASLYLVEKGKNWLSKFIKTHWYMIFMSFFLLLLPTGSRKSLIAFCAIFIFYSIIKQKELLKGLLVLFTITSITFLIFWKELVLRFESSIMGERFLSQDAFESGIYSRKFLYDQAIDIFIHNPIFGIGLNNFRYHSDTGEVTHSYYMEMLTGTGILGFLIIFSVYFLMTRRAFVLYKNNAYNNESIFIFNFLFLTLIMSFGFSYHLSFIHWFIITFIFIFLDLTKQNTQLNDA